MADDDSIETNEATEDPEARWTGLSTVMAGLITIVYVMLPLGAAFGILNLGAVTQPWFLMLSLAFLTVLAYTFGQGKLEAAKKALGE